MDNFLLKGGLPQNKKLPEEIKKPSKDLPPKFVPWVEK
jgi:hypothetical protein